MARRRTRRGGRRIARGQYKYTPKRQMALRKAQMVSARKRKGLSRRAKVGITAGVATGVVLGGAIARHKISGSSLSVTTHSNGRGLVGVSHKVHTQQHGTDHPAYTFSHGGTRYSASGKELPSYNTHVLTGNVRNAGLTAKYRHKPVTAAQIKEALFGKKTPSGGPPPQADPRKQTKHYMTQHEKDAIPFTNRQAGSTWPHIGAEDARAQNQAIRDGTHYVSPGGVRQYPKSAKKRAEIDERIMRRSMGLGWTVAGQKEHLFAPPNSIIVAPPKRRRRKRKKKS